MNIRRGSRSIPFGFSLIEVLLSVVIISGGLLALTALQGSLFKASAEAKAQSVALGLAQEKIEYFRGFRTMAEYQAATTGSDAARTIGGVSYTRSWTVTRCAYPNAGGNFDCSVALTGTLSTNPTTGYAENNEFKRVVVNVTWTDAANGAQRVSLEDAVAALNPADSAKLGKLSPGSNPRGPEVRIYNPENQQQGVIPIAIGNGTDTAATNPKPLVNGSNVIETRFDVLTYNDINTTKKTATVQARVETSVVGCTCDYGAASSTQVAMRPTYWDGARYVIPETATSIISGYVTPAGSANSTQSSLCTICCRDHHDPATLPAGAAKFDPRNTDPITGHSAGHSLMGATTGIPGTQSTAGLYTESCRVIRVGGLFRVAADTYNDYQNFVLTKNDGSTTAYLPTAAGTTNYQNFVKAYLKARVITPTVESSWNNVLPVSAPSTVVSLEGTHTNYRTQPDSIPFQPADSEKWLHLRGLYVDYLEDKALQAIKDAKDGCVGSGTGGAPTATELESCVLSVLPFTSINLTELGIYSPLSSSTKIVVANNNFLDTLSSTAPVRGKVTRINGATAGTENASATMLRSNSGLTAWAALSTRLGAIDTEDYASTEPSRWVAIQPYEIRGAGGGGGSSDAFQVSLFVPPSLANYPFGENAQTPFVRDSFGGTVTCNPSSGTNNPYNCTPTTSLGLLRSLLIGNYNYERTVSSTAPLTCEDGLGNQRTYTGPYNTLQCRTYSVAKVTINGADPLVPVGIFQLGTYQSKGETTSVGTMLINNGDRIGIVFGAPVDIDRSATCTFSTRTVCDNKPCTQSHTETSYTVTPQACP